MNAHAAGASCARLGLERWHFQHGPIDLIIDVDADAATRERTIGMCWQRFQAVLPGLVRELPELRRAAVERPRVDGPVARRMLRACSPFAPHRFITPMAAVAGAVADELIGVFDAPGVERASINNGGDIALILTPGNRYRVGIRSLLEVGPPRGAIVANAAAVDENVSTGDDNASINAAFTIEHSMPVRGIATSGWRGRSFSLGIADSVTVLARDAAGADAAATLIANAVNCEHAGIVRARAADLKDDTDLGERLVTVQVPCLPPSHVAAALARGCQEAERWHGRGLIFAAALFLQGQSCLVPARAGIAAVRRTPHPSLEVVA